MLLNQQLNKAHLDSLLAKSSQTVPMRKAHLTHREWAIFLWPSQKGEIRGVMALTKKGMESRTGKLKIHGGFKSDGAAVKGGPKKK